MSEFMFKLLLSTVNTFISHKMRDIPISTQRYNKHCSSNEWVGKCIDVLALLYNQRLGYFLISRNTSRSLFKGVTWICAWGRNNAVRHKFRHQLEDGVPFCSVSVYPQSAALSLRWDWPPDAGIISPLKYKLFKCMLTQLCLTSNTTTDLLPVWSYSLPCWKKYIFFF